MVYQMVGGTVESRMIKRFIDIQIYGHHVNALCPWTTRETPENDATKGSIRLRNCSLEIDAEGVATLKAIEEMTA
jgi:hypothetical protein